MEANLVTPEALRGAVESTLSYNAEQMAYQEGQLAMYWLMDCQGQDTYSLVSNLAWHAKKRAQHRAKLIAACEILDADI